MLESGARYVELQVLNLLIYKIKREKAGITIFSLKSKFELFEKKMSVFFYVLPTYKLIYSKFLRTYFFFLISCLGPQCSMPCDTGVQKREVTCLDNEEQTSQGCAESSKPITRRACNTHACTVQSK